MFSARTNIELAYAIEKMTKANIERMLIAFSLGDRIFPIHNFSNAKLANIFLGYLNIPNHAGPFSKSFSVDVLQHLIDNYYRDKKPSYNFLGGQGAFENLFNSEYLILAHSLKRDGFIIKGSEVTKVLPVEIEEAKTETELFNLLNKFSFSQSKTHLKQSIDNHSAGQWAAANGQFRTFIESLLMEICVKISGNTCSSASNAITALSNLNPPFLSEVLNEVKSSSNNIDVGFVNGLWKRLHPQGSHPGISDDEDCTFRYHISIVFAHYLLKRLAKRLGII